MLLTLSINQLINTSAIKGAIGEPIAPHLPMNNIFR